MIAVGCDHGGYELKEFIKQYLDQKGIEYLDVGAFSSESVDYAPIAQRAAELVASGQAEKGLLFCGTGIGMSLAANKVRGIRAAVCSDEFSAKFTRLHNDANVLCLGGRVVAPDIALRLVELFLTTEFEGGRHERRVKQIMDIENSRP